MTKISFNVKKYDNKKNLLANCLELFVEGLDNSKNSKF